MPTDLLSWVLGVHAVVLSLSLTGLYRYSDRSTLFARALGDSDALLLRVRRRVATALEDELRPVIERAGGEALIVSPTGYAERPIDAVSGDSFREAIHRFLHTDATAIVDYGRLYNARNKWCFWARALSWTVLGLSCWEALCLFVLGLLGMFFNVAIPDSIAASSLGPTAFLTAAFFSCHAGLLRQHDVIHDNKSRYPEL